MSFSYNSIAFAYDVKSPLELMDIYVFVGTFKYPIDMLYIDRFWNCINNSEWIVIDYATLKWIGYDCANDFDNKAKYVKLLRSNFIESTDYEIMSGKDIALPDLKVGHKNVLIVSPKTFKRTLMMLRTAQGENIRNYYLMVEEILLDYMRYTKCVIEHNNELEKSKLMASIEEYKNQAESERSFDFARDPLVMTEFVYVLTSKRYYAKSMFKVGRTTNLKSRLVSYNTGTALSEDDLFYVSKIPTLDAKGLEQLLHRALCRYHSSKEWFRVPHSHLSKIVELVISQQKALSDKINDCLSSAHESMPMPAFIEQTKTIELEEKPPIPTNTPDELEEKPPAPIEQAGFTCEKCGKAYVFEASYTKHIAMCAGAKCNRCQRVFSNDRELNVHLQRKIKCKDPNQAPLAESNVSEERPFQCSDCNHTFTTEPRYTNHIKDGCKYRKQCDYCKRVFRGTIFLENHLKTSQCGQKETPAEPSAKPIKTLRWSRTEDMQYRCSACNKKCISTTAIKNHLKKCTKSK